MNYLKDRKCYLSGAIQYDISPCNWRDAPTKVLTEELGIDLYDPFQDPKQQWLPALKEAKAKKDFDRMAEIANSFVRKDLEMVVRSDFLIAYLPTDPRTNSCVSTVGTHEEIITAFRLKKPVLIVASGSRAEIPLWYWGYIPYQFMFDSWSDLYIYLKEVTEGNHKQNRRWDFVYGLI